MNVGFWRYRGCRGDTFFLGIGSGFQYLTSSFSDPTRRYNCNSPSQPTREELTDNLYRKYDRFTLISLVEPSYVQPRKLSQLTIRMNKYLW